MICERAIFFYTHRLRVWFGVQEIHDDRVERWLDNQVTRLRDHLEVFEETIPEEVVNNVEAVLISAWIVGGGAWGCGLYHISFVNLNLLLLKRFIINSSTKREMVDANMQANI